MTRVPEAKDRRGETEEGREEEVSSQPQLLEFSIEGKKNRAFSGGNKGTKWRFYTRTKSLVCT